MSAATVDLLIVTLGAFSVTGIVGTIAWNRLTDKASR